MPLYGQELGEEISPLEAGLGFAVKMSKQDFIGKKALLEKGDPANARVGLKVTGRGIAREGCPILAGDKQIGRVTSGTHLPYMNGAYAMGFVEKAYSAAGTKIMVDVRGRKVEAQVVLMPFYKL